jgi:hypothetical protein
MGNAFWILVFDGYGLGLDLISPRLFELYDEKKMIRRNSFSYREREEIDQFIRQHRLAECFYGYKVIG